MMFNNNTTNRIWKPHILFILFLALELTCKTRENCRLLGLHIHSFTTVQRQARRASTPNCGFWMMGAPACRTSTPKRWPMTWINRSLGQRLIKNHWKLNMWPANWDRDRDRPGPSKGRIETAGWCFSKYQNTPTKHGDLRKRRVSTQQIVEQRELDISNRIEVANNWYY